jgi:hypothetical protein
LRAAAGVGLVAARQIPCRAPPVTPRARLDDVRDLASPTAGAGAATAGGVTADTPPEQHFPVPIVALHGVLAVTTVVLVLLTAAGVGGS